MTGTVTLDGIAVEAAGVLFEPVAGGPAADGVTDAEGRFTLQSANKAGVFEGEYKVTITKKKQTGIRDDETIAPGGIKTEWIIPQRYSEAKTSGMTAQVPSEKYLFELKSK